MDANPAALSIAAENLLRNGFSTEFRLVLRFIGNLNDREIQFFTVGTGQAGSKYRSHAATASARNSSIMVKTVTLDRITTELGITPDLIKIDIEGAEAEALSGAIEITRRYQPRYLVEMHSPRELPMKENVDFVLQWCKTVGYQAYYLKEHTKLTTSGPIAHRGRCHLLLQASDLAYPYFLKELQQGDSLEKARSVMERLGVKTSFGNSSIPERTVLTI